MQMMLNGRQERYLFFPSIKSADSRIAQWCLIESGNEQGTSGGKGEQQCDRSTLCKPSGLVIIVWAHRRTIWCQGALWHSHSQFMNARFVSEHIKT